MRSKHSQAVALALAMTAIHAQIPIPKTPEIPEKKSSDDLDKLAKAEEKRIRKAKKRLAIKNDS